MKVAIIYNKDIQGVINKFGIQNKEFYDENTVKHVAKCLEKGGHNVAILDGNKQIIDRLENFMPRVMEGEQMGMVFNMAYGIQGESRYTHIPGMLEMLGVPYVGSSPSGHTLALDKVLTKIIWKNNNLPTPDFWVFNSEDSDLSNVKFPVIVKPKMESVSFGLKIVDNKKDLKEAISFIIKEYDQQALVEQFIKGREFVVGLLGNSPVECFPVLEIDLEGNPDNIQTKDNKQKNPYKKICPANISTELAEKMQNLSKEAFRALNLRDFSRVDIRLDQEDNIFLLEINSMASLGKNGSYPAAAKVAAYNYENLVNKMLDVASVRYFTNRIHEDNPDKKESKLPHIKIRSFINTRQELTEKFLNNIVNINTYVRNLEGVNHCTELIGNKISQLGFTREVIPCLEVGNIQYLTNTGSKETDFLILLPVDNRTKLADHENFTDREQYIEGSGVWESKGGVAVLISALQSLRFTRALKKLKIGILLITDSTINGKYSKSIIQQKSAYAKKVIALSGSSKNGGIITSRAGSALFNYESKLIDKSSAENVSKTAIDFNKTLSSIIDISKTDKENIISPFEVNFKSNIFKISAHGYAGISVRYVSEDILSLTEQKIKKIINQQKRKKIYQIQFEGSQNRPPMQKTEKTADFYKAIQKISKIIDVRISEEHRWSSSDICHVERDIPKIDGIGPVGEFLPSNNERILRYSLIEKALLLAMILLEKIKK